MPEITIRAQGSPRREVGFTRRTTTDNGDPTWDAMQTVSIEDGQTSFGRSVDTDVRPDEDIVFLNGKRVTGRELNVPTERDDRVVISAMLGSSQCAR